MTNRKFVPHLIYFTVILAAWIGAWVLQLALTDYFELFRNEWATFLYWFIARIFIWILPAFWILKKYNKKLKNVLRVQTLKHTLVWGLGIGGIFLALNIGYRIIHSNWSILGDRPLLSFIDFVILAPFFEEFLMRGAILSTLKQKFSFLKANTITALLFVLLHCPGWYFTGVLQLNFLHPLTGALAIFIIGFMCGMAAERGKSLYSAMIVHMLNNIV